MFIKVDSVSKMYGEYKAIDDISFEVSSGIVFGLLGPNGAGKTSLIRMILDIIKPDTGSITYNNHSFSLKDKNKIGYLPEERGLYKSQKVLDILVYIAQLNGMSKEEAIKQADYYLDKLNILDQRNKPLGGLSKGQQQKVQFISTIIFDPEIVILDEPFSGLDPLNNQVIKNLILEMKSHNKIIILSTHQMHRAEELSDYVFIMNKGKKLLNGILKDLQENYYKNEYLVKSNLDYDNTEIISRYFIDPEGTAHIVLNDNFTSNDLIYTIINNGYDLEHFEKRTISLEDLFIKLVKEDDNR